MPPFPLPFPSEGFLKEFPGLDGSVGNPLPTFPDPEPENERGQGTSSPVQTRKPDFRVVEDKEISFIHAHIDLSETFCVPPLQVDGGRPKALPDPRPPSLG